MSQKRKLQQLQTKHQKKCKDLEKKMKRESEREIKRLHKKRNEVTEEYVEEYNKFEVKARMIRTVRGMSTRDFNLATDSIDAYKKQCEKELEDLRATKEMEHDRLVGHYTKEIETAQRRIKIRQESIKEYTKKIARDHDLFLLEVCRKECKGRAIINRIPSGKIRDQKDSLYLTFHGIYTETVSHTNLGGNLCSIITEYAMIDYIEWQFDIISYKDARFVAVFEDTLYATRDGKIEFGVNIPTGEYCGDMGTGPPDYYANCEKYVDLRNMRFEVAERVLMRTFEDGKRLLGMFYEIENLKEGERIYHVEAYDYERVLYIKGQKNEFTVSVGVLRID
jgi:hypothetical protein